MGNTVCCASSSSQPSWCRLRSGTPATPPASGTQEGVGTPCWNSDAGAVLSTPAPTAEELAQWLDYNRTKLPGSLGNRIAAELLRLAKVGRALDGANTIIGQQADEAKSLQDRLSSLQEQYMARVTELSTLFYAERAKVMPLEDKLTAAERERDATKSDGRQSLVNLLHEALISRGLWSPGTENGSDVATAIIAQVSRATKAEADLAAMTRERDEEQRERDRAIAAAFELSMSLTAQTALVEKLRGITDKLTIESCGGFGAMNKDEMLANRAYINRLANEALALTADTQGGDGK